MINRETGKTYKSSPMGGTPRPKVDNLMRTKILPSKTEELVDKLVTAYNSRAMANPSAPLMSKTSSTVEPIDGGNYLTHNVRLETRDGNRLGFIGKDTDFGGVTYSAAHDLGNPDRGVLDVTLNTPMGNVSRGYEQETDYLSYATPRFSQTNGLDIWYNNGFEHPIEMRAGMGASDSMDGNLYADAKLPISQQRSGNFNTPLGDFSYGTFPGNNGYAYADYTPNEQMQYYIKALANLLNR